MVVHVAVIVSTAIRVTAWQVLQGKTVKLVSTSHFCSFYPSVGSFTRSFLPTFLSSHVLFFFYLLVHFFIRQAHVFLLSYLPFFCSCIPFIRSFIFFIIQFMLFSPFVQVICFLPSFFLTSPCSFLLSFVLLFFSFVQYYTYSSMLASKSLAGLLSFHPTLSSSYSSFLLSNFVLSFCLLHHDLKTDIQRANHSADISTSGINRT